MEPVDLAMPGCARCGGTGARIDATLCVCVLEAPCPGCWSKGANRIWQCGSFIADGEFSQTDECRNRSSEIVREAVVAECAADQILSLRRDDELAH